MSITRLRSDAEERYKRFALHPSKQSFWAPENYYNIDDILATSEQVTFRFESTISKSWFYQF